MKGTVVLAIVALLGSSVSGLDIKREQNMLTTPDATTDLPTLSTAISLSPQTSISVHHTIVRNQPAYPYPYTESTLQTDGTEDTSYYYTYEDISEDANKKFTSTMTPTTKSTTTTKPTVKSFWNSQKALLDARRKESAYKFKPTYNRQNIQSKGNKPTIEFKVRERPKFGQANKHKFSTTTTIKYPEVTSSKPVELSTHGKVVKSDAKLNLPAQKLSNKEEIEKKLKNLNLNVNQLLGRFGELPVQGSRTAQIQSPIRAQSTIINSFGGSRPSKFDASVGNVQFVDNARKLQQPVLSNGQSQNNLLSNLNQQSALNNLKTLPSLNLNPQPSVQVKLNQQPLLNQQTSVNLNQRPLLNLNQQPLQNNLKNAPSNAFIAATAPLDTSGRSGTISGQSLTTNLLQRLGSLGLNLNGGTNGLNNAIQGRDVSLGGRAGGGVVTGGGIGGGGGGNGFVLNLGAIPDPISFFLRLFSLIPRPLLDLNGRIFFGIELGKNAGLVSGVPGRRKAAFNG